MSSEAGGRRAIGCVGCFLVARRAEGAGKGVVLPFIIMDCDVAVAVQRLVNGLLRVGADILIRLRQMHHQRLADGMAFVKLLVDPGAIIADDRIRRSEEHTSELQSLMRISYAVFCLKKKINNK